METSATFPDRKLLITGVYSVDTKTRDFGSYSTTTLLIGRDPAGHVFTHTNLAIRDDIYMKLETSDALLKTTIQSSPEWRHYTKATIPKNLDGVAVPGPIQDNLQILGNKGAWVSKIKKQESSAWGAPLVQYTFKLSGRQPKTNDAARSIASRIGAAGVIDVWIDPQSSEPRYLRFSNDSYVSTTTIFALNVPLPLSAPAGQ